MKRLARTFRRALPLVVLGVCATATPASARPLPPPPERVEKYISATVAITYLPGLGTFVTPGGDAAWAFDCVTTDDGRGTVDVTCTKDAGSDYVLTCSKIDVTGTTFGTPSFEPRLDGRGWCSDNVDTWVETMPPPGTVRPYRSFLHLSTERLGCATAGPPDVAYTVTCAFSAAARQPIVGGVVMTGTTGGFTWTTWGVLSGPDWECVALSTLVPTVRCMTRQDTTQWFCNQTFAMADGTGSPVPLRVRAQTTCDTKVLGAAPPEPAPVNGRGTFGPNVVSTEEVPTLSGGTSDTYMDWLDHDANVFFCQAFGPVGTPAAITPWTVHCWEP